jgi:hypothetical protein
MIERTHVVWISYSAVYLSEMSNSTKEMSWPFIYINSRGDSVSKTFEYARHCVSKEMPWPFIYINSRRDSVSKAFEFARNCVSFLQRSSQIYVINNYLIHRIAFKVSYSIKVDNDVEEVFWCISCSSPLHRSSVLSRFGVYWMLCWNGWIELRASFYEHRRYLFGLCSYCL